MATEDKGKETKHDKDRDRRSADEPRPHHHRDQKLKTQKTALTKALEPDFEAHEAECRNGVKTDAGVLVRKPKWNFDAKPVVEVAG